MNVLLMGITGSGKSTLGPLLARELRYGFVDLDEKIAAQQGCSIAKLIKKRGIGAFRELELRTLRLFSGCKHQVISLGGGLPQDENGLRLVRSLGTLVWLEVPIRVMAARLLRSREELSKRPLVCEALSAHRLTPLQEDSMQAAQLRQDLEAYLSQRYEKMKEFGDQADLVFRDYYSEPMFAARQIVSMFKREPLSRVGKL
ncbi:MAG: hypothetical protein OXT67_01705 [Zetaproteobacteria bacterium]|nr:hypothetical protein [Zetaproteobacteria bacterium]